MFEFAHPWLFLLLPLPLLVRWLVPAYQEAQPSIRVPFFQRIVEITGQKPRKGAVILQRVLFQKFWVPVTWGLLVVALAQPQLLGDPIEQTRSARDLMVAVDLSGSMEVTDFSNQQGVNISRLDAVKLVLAEFAKQRQHDRLGLIVFGDSPYLQVPFTEDHAAWITLLNETEIAMAGQSTMFGDAIGFAIKLFENSETENQVLIVLTDGNDTGSKMPPVEAAKIAAHKQVTIYTIAIGDPETIGESALDLDVLESIAEVTDGGFYHALDRDQLENAYRDIAQIEPEEYETLSYRPRQTLHYYPLAVILIGYLIFFMAMTLQSVIRSVRDKKQGLTNA